MEIQQNDSLNDTAITRLACQALTCYPLEYQGKVTLLCRSENATFMIEAGGKRYALRVHRSHYHDRNEIEGEMQWLNALRRDTDIVVPQAIPDRGGRCVLTLQLANGTERYVDLFHWIDGEMPTNCVDPKSFLQLGEVTAKLHLQSKQWQKPEGFKRIIWNYQTMVGAQGHWGNWRDAPGLKPEDHAIIEAAVAKVGEKMAAYGQSPQRYGLIHADLRLTNLLFFRGQTRVIDFDDCGMGWYLHDLAAAISFEEHHPNAEKWVYNWLEGYERIAHWETEDLAMLASMIIQRRIQMTAWMATHAQTETAKRLEPCWASDTARLCHRYLETDKLPVGED